MLEVGEGLELTTEGCPDACLKRFEFCDRDIQGRNTHKFVGVELVEEGALGGEPLFALMMFTSLTGLVLLSAFWYEAF